MSDGGIGDARKNWKQHKVEPAIKRGASGANGSPPAPTSRSSASMIPTT